MSYADGLIQAKNGANEPPRQDSKGPGIKKKAGNHAPGKVKKLRKGY